jgi:hypothetical protein
MATTYAPRDTRRGQHPTLIPLLLSAIVSLLIVVLVAGVFLTTAS